MPKVRFLENFDFHVPGKPMTIAYKKNWTGLVVTPCAVEAIAKGKAIKVQREVETVMPSDEGPQA